jgi:SNF2 family DNA or RNA helicase
MAVAQATLGEGRVELRVRHSYGEFEYVLAQCKRVSGGRFDKKSPADKFWHYPLSVDTCTALRRVWGKELRVGVSLGAWYVEEAAKATAQAELSAATDASLPRTPAALASWLRGYQRAGAAWVGKGYRGAGLVADTPGLGKTTELLAGLLEANVQGPVLVVCPKASVKSVWAKEISEHLPGVPAYLCAGTREKREAELARFANDIVSVEASNQLRIVVVVAEMLRVELGDPCYTNAGNKISGMCSQRRKSVVSECHLHQAERERYAKDKEPKEREKDQVPVDFSYPVLFDQYLLGSGWAAVVLDESHKLLGSLTVVRGNLMGKGLKLLPYRSDARRYAMSGTPFGKGGRAEGMFGTLNWLWPDEYTSFWRWAGEVFEMEDKVINRRGVTAKKIVGLKGLGRNASAEQEAEALERWLHSLGPRILRRTKAEALPDLPPKNYVEVACHMLPAQQKQLIELADFAEVTTPNGTVMCNGHLPMLMRSRQIANGVISLRKEARTERGKVYFSGESGKLDQLWQALDERGILDGVAGPKVIIASEFNEFLDTIMWRLNKEKIGYFRIDGSTTEKMRDKQMGEWQSDASPLNVRVMLLNTKAGGVSITLDAADEMHIMDEDPDPGVNEQLEDRIHRASRNHRVTIYYYRTVGSIDYKKAHEVEYRRKVQHAVLDGRRGQEYVREFIKEALEGKGND